MLREHRLRVPFSGDADFVFSTAKRTPLDQSNVRRSFGRAVRQAGLERLPLHDLRHVAASAWIAVGIDPVTVSGQLGMPIRRSCFASTPASSIGRHAEGIRTAPESA
jgi:integrase